MQDFFEEVIRKLSESRAEFVIVGGLSAVLQGAPIVTLDIDICYRRTPENIRRLAAALAPFGPRLRGMPADVPTMFDERSLLMGTNFTLEIGKENIDLLGEMSGLGGYEQIIGQTDLMSVAGAEVRVLTLGQLIQTKEAAGRDKDHAVLPLLRAVLAKQQESRRDDPPAVP